MNKAIISILLIVGASLVLWYTGGSSQLDEISLAEREIGIELKSELLSLNGIELHTVFAGPIDGEPVILIHGFPQSWFAWRWHIKTLAEHGYRVAAVDMRGYNRSSKPSSADPYEYEDYAADIIGLMDSQEWQQANIVSHDIGGIVGWELVFDQAHRVKRAVVFSAAHPLAYARSATKSDISWYRTFFRLPILPELISRLGGLSLTANGMRDSSRAGTFTDNKLAVHKEAWRRDHAFYSMLGSYRNNGLDLKSMPSDGVPSMPVMYINGALDQFVAPEVALATKDYIGADNVKLYSDLSHWLLEEEPDKTAADILAFFAKPVD